MSLIEFETAYRQVRSAPPQWKHQQGQEPGREFKSKQACEDQVLRLCWGAVWATVTRKDKKKTSGFNMISFFFSSHHFIMVWTCRIMAVDGRSLLVGVLGNRPTQIIGFAVSGLFLYITQDKDPSGFIFVHILFLFVWNYYTKRKLFFYITFAQVYFLSSL